MLTEIKASRLRPQERPYKVADGGGLYLLVNPDGTRYWRLKYRYGGKEKLLGLGVYPAVKIADARAGRDEAKRLLRDGVDPSAANRARRRAAAVSGDNTFESIAREWIGAQALRWSSDHAAQVLGTLEADVFPALGKRPIGEISPPELLAVIRKIEHRGALETAQRVLQRCGAAFAYGVASGRCERNIALDIRGALKTRPKVKHRPALSERDLPEFLGKLDAYDGHAVTKLALALQALTFVRPKELREAEWAEFDLDAAEWHIPAERMKMRDPHNVPLSRQALEALGALRAITGGGRFLFPSQTKPGGVISENTMLYALYRMGYHSRATGHGFRATASTILNEQGWNRDAIERQLAHAERNKVRAAYHRSEYLDTRRKMMQAWADYLDGLRSGANVSPIRRATA